MKYILIIYKSKYTVSAVQKPLCNDVSGSKYFITRRSAVKMKFRALRREILFLPVVTVTYPRIFLRETLIRTCSRTTAPPPFCVPPHGMAYRRNDLSPETSQCAFGEREYGGPDRNNLN